MSSRDNTCSMKSSSTAITPVVHDCADRPTSCCTKSVEVKLMDGPRVSYEDSTSDLMSLVAGPGRAEPSNQSSVSIVPLAIGAHVRYIRELNEQSDNLDYHFTEHLRISGTYWGLNSLHLLGQPDALPREALLEFVLSCFHADSGGFGAAPGHDPHILNTVYAVQILSLTNGFGWLESRVDNCKKRIAQYIAHLQRTDGSFSGDEWGEVDTRFTYGAFNALSLLGLLPNSTQAGRCLINVRAATAHIKACQNFDGGFGLSPGAESHSGQVFTCVGALAIAGELDDFLGEQGKDRLGAWLSERQLRNGGLNGRPEKLEDVCYSWWVMSSLAIIQRLHWIDKQRLADFILKCQDAHLGGLADRPGDAVDVFHTNFGVAGLSLVGYQGLEEVDPVYCLPKRITQALTQRNSKIEQ